MEDNFFSSSIGKDEFGIQSTSFEAIELKFKSQSEHTINGEHYDLELQIYFRGVIADTPPGPRQ